MPLRTVTLDDTPTWARPRPREQLSYKVGRSSLGLILVATSAAGVVAILIGDESRQLVATLHQLFPEADLAADARTAGPWLKKVIAYIAKPAGTLDLPLDLRGTAFQKRVWQEVQKVLPGQISSYTEIARRIAHDKAVRAVGTACASNRLALAIPCHRILRKDGTFAGGEFWLGDRHRRMLQREAAAAKKR
jgi:AraC family transcriptional regulator of adaptative response/methylated-DNA-[protein]-cysteine methyltransferase